MNEQLEKQLVRQLKILNVWITTFGVLMLLTLGTIGLFLWQAATFIRSTNDNIQLFLQTITEKLDATASVCGGTNISPILFGLPACASSS